MIGTLYQLINRHKFTQTGGMASNAHEINWGVLLISLIIYLILITLFGQWIWNNILVKYVTIVKPIESAYEVWLLVVLFHILFPHSINLGT